MRAVLDRLEQYFRETFIRITRSLCSYEIPRKISRSCMSFEPLVVARYIARYRSAMSHGAARSIRIGFWSVKVLRTRDGIDDLWFLHCETIQIDYIIKTFVCQASIRNYWSCCVSCQPQLWKSKYRFPEIDWNLRQKIMIRIAIGDSYLNLDLLKIYWNLGQKMAISRDGDQKRWRSKDGDWPNISYSGKILKIEHENGFGHADHCSTHFWIKPLKFRCFLRF